MQYVFFYLISQLQPTGLATVQKLRATEGEADVCHRGDGRLRTGVRATWSKKWVQESEGIKDRQCSNQGASFEKKKKQRGQVFRVIVLLHACTHLAWYLCWCVCESLHVAAETLGCAKILYSFKPKQGSCSCLLECAAKYAWDPENSPSDICSSVFFPARDHVIAGNEVASGLQSSLNQKGHRF